MTTVLSEKGQVVLPALIRKRLQLKPGEDFEISIENDDTIVLRRISTPANFGLIKTLCSPPFSFSVPARDKDDSSPITL